MHADAQLGYMSPIDARPYNYAFEPSDGTPSQNYPHDLRTLAIEDARRMPSPTSLEHEGFELRDAPTAVADFSDKDAIGRIYYPELAELACAVTGATQAYIFDYLVRKLEPREGPLGFGRNGGAGHAAANGRVHNDYTEESGRRRLGLVLGAEDGLADGQRFSIINIWRPIRGPVLDAPLAVCDARTVSTFDLVVAEVRYPRRVGEIYLARYSPRHRWHYFSAMDRHEALVFKQYDSLVSGVARFTPHAAFYHPDAPAGMPPRESIEARVLVIYD